MPQHSHAIRRARRAAFTLVEALVSMTITATAGAALLLGIASAVQTTQTVVDQSVALGLAEQLMDEIALSRYAEPGLGPFQSTLGPETGEAIGTNRLAWDDIDDYHGLDEQPPRDRWGLVLGVEDGRGTIRHANFQPPPGFLAGFRRQARVYYVSAADPTVPLPTGQTSGFRAVHVRVYSSSVGGGSAPLVDLKRVFAYVPEP
jgi:type II secretory pathway pseudopilin PulG